MSAALNFQFFRRSSIRWMKRLHIDRTCARASATKYDFGRPRTVRFASTSRHDSALAGGQARHDADAKLCMNFTPCVFATEREHYFLVFLDLAVFLDFSKSSVLGAPGSDGLRMCSLLPSAMRFFSRGCWHIGRAWRWSSGVLLLGRRMGNGRNCLS